MLYEDNKAIIATEEFLESYKPPTRQDLFDLTGRDGARWKPVPHQSLIGWVEQAFERYNVDIFRRMFQVDTKTTHNLYACWELDIEVVGAPCLVRHEFGLRSSNVQQFAIMGLEAARVGFCENGMAFGNILFNAKHSLYNWHEGLIWRKLGHFIRQIRAGTSQAQKDIAMMQDLKFESDAEVLWFLKRMSDDKVFPWNHVPAIFALWETPTHVEFAKARDGWRLYQAINTKAKDWRVDRQESALVSISEEMRRIYYAQDS